MTIKKIPPTHSKPQSLQLIRGSGTVIAEVTCSGLAKIKEDLILAEIEQVQYLIKNFNLIYESL